MSHFSVLVVGDNVEAQLAPFHEFECTGLNDQYVVEQDITQEVQARIDSGESVTEALAEWGYDEKIVQSEAQIDREGEHKYGYAIVTPFERSVAVEGVEPEVGRLVKAVRRTNPNAKWDWWVIGGRWGGFFTLKPGAS